MTFTKFNELPKINLDNGNVIFKAVGKYLPNVMIITPSKEFKFEFVEDEELNKMGLDYHVVYRLLTKGQYRKSQKGNHVFDLTRGDSYFYACRWGGGGRSRSEQKRGLDFEKIARHKDTEYFRVAHSNGWGVGIDYFITKKPLQQIIKEIVESEIS